MLGHYLLEAEASHDLSILSAQFTGFNLMNGESSSHEKICERADVGLQIKSPLQRELETRGHSRLMNRIEMPLALVLSGMESEGVKLDVDALAVMSEELKKDSDERPGRDFQNGRHGVQPQLTKTIG